MNKRQKKKLFNRKCGYRLVKLPRNFQTWVFQYYTGIGAVTYKRICTEKIPYRAKYLINTRNVENFNQVMRRRRHEKRWSELTEAEINRNLERENIYHANGNMEDMKAWRI